MPELIFLNGAFVREAKIPVDDRGYTIGDGLFETIPLYDSKPFLLKEHLVRLAGSAEIIGLKIPFRDDEVEEIIGELAEKNSVSRGVARLTLTRGVGPRGYGSEGCHNPSRVLTVRRYSPLPSYIYERGFTLTQAAIRKNRFSPLSSMKSTSSIERTLLIDSARSRGADEALCLTAEGWVSSCSSSNIFWLKAETLYTPSLNCAILPGVTRGSVLKLAEELGIRKEEGSYKVTDLDFVSEVFITNSLMEIMPVSRLAGRFNSGGPGELTKKISARLKALIKSANGD